MTSKIDSFSCRKTDFIFVLTLHTAAVLSRFQNTIRSRHGVTGCVYENIQVEYSIVDIVQSICYAAWIGEYLVMDLATLLGDVHCILHREGGGTCHAHGSSGTQTFLFWLASFLVKFGGQAKLR